MGNRSKEEGAAEVEIQYAPTRSDNATRSAMSPALEISADEGWWPVGRTATITQLRD